MTSVSLPAIRTPSVLRVPFCDKNFQMLRVIVSRISDICIATLLKVAAFFVSICSKKTSDHFRSLAAYYQVRSENVLTFLRYGSKIVDFSMNMGKPKIGHTESGMDALRKIYGHEAIAHWSTIATPEAPLNHTKLVFGNKGCCFGMSIDFISRYLRELQKNKTPIEAVKAIAPIYAEGTTEEAELAQIFYHAVDTSLLDSRFAAILEEDGRLSEEFRQHEAASINNHRMESIVARRTVLISELRQINQTLEDIKPSAVARKMGLAVQVIGDVNIQTLDQMDSAFLQFVNNLNQGMYAVNLWSGEINHTLVVIKTATEHFIFDSNYATLTLSREDIAKDLWSTCQDYGIKMMTFKSITPIV